MKARRAVAARARAIRGTSCAGRRERRTRSARKWISPHDLWRQTCGRSVARGAMFASQRRNLINRYVTSAMSNDSADDVFAQAAARKQALDAQLATRPVENVTGLVDATGAGG